MKIIISNIFKYVKKQNFKIMKENLFRLNEETETASNNTSG